MGQRTGRRILARLASAAVHGCVDVEGQGISGLGCRAELLYIGSVIIGLKLFLCIYVVAKHLRPCAPLGYTQVLEQLFGHAAAVSLLGQR